MTNTIVRYFSRVGIALSVLLNVILGGSSNQTFSARNYALKRAGKPNLVGFLDALSGEKDHCMTSWAYWFLRKDVQYEMKKEKENG